MKRILIIENNNELQENFSELLNFYGYKVYISNNFAEGAIKALSVSPDLILCDVNNRNLKDLAVFNTLSRFLRLKKIPFILMSTLTELKDRKLLMKSGAFAYLEKPIEEGELLFSLENALKTIDFSKNLLFFR